MGQTSDLSKARGLPGTRLACVFFKPETIVQASVETLVRESDEKLNWVRTTSGKQ